MHSLGSFLLVLDGYRDDEVNEVSGGFFFVRVGVYMHMDSITMHIVVRD